MEDTIVITGGNGFVGRHLVNELQNEWPWARLIVWDKSIEGLSEKVEGLEVDITRPDGYKEGLVDLQPNWVVHLAAIAPIPAAMKNPDLTRKVNTEATKNLLEAVVELSGKTKVLAISSSDIYGAAMMTNGQSPEGKPSEDDDTPLVELSLSEARPTNPYAVSKLEMEKIIENHFNDRVIRARPFPHIGPGQGKGFVTADFAAQIAVAEKGEEAPVVHVGNLNTSRDFTDVRDVVRAYRLLMEKGSLGEVYHVATGRAVRIQDILDRLLQLSTIKMDVVLDKNKVRKSEAKRRVGSTEKLKESTGWVPRIDLDKSLADILEWWRLN